MCRSFRSGRKAFSGEEDAELLRIVGGCVSPRWDEVALQMHGRSARQCRERWFNYVNPAIRSDAWTDSEDEKLVEKLNEMGHLWSSMTALFEGRSESDIKNRWYSHVQYQCLLNPYTAKWERVAGDVQGRPVLQRKKRSRTKPCPSQAAQKFLARTEKEPKGGPSGGSAAPPALPGGPASAGPPSHQCDFWDSALCDGALEEYPFCCWSSTSEP